MVIIVHFALMCIGSIISIDRVSPPAQQEAQRAQFYVEKAKQDQRHKIIQAEGEAEAAKMVSSLQDGDVLLKIQMRFIRHLSIRKCLPQCAEYTR